MVSSCIFVVQVERRHVDDLSAKEFFEQYASRHTPVVITGLVDHMTSTQPWTLDYIKKVTVITPSNHVCCLSFTLYSKAFSITLKIELLCYCIPLTVLAPPPLKGKLVRCNFHGSIFRIETNLKIFHTYFSRMDVLEMIHSQFPIDSHL